MQIYVSPALLSFRGGNVQDEQSYQQPTLMVQRANEHTGRACWAQWRAQLVLISMLPSTLSSPRNRSPEEGTYTTILLPLGGFLFIFLLCSLIVLAFVTNFFFGFSFLITPRVRSVVTAPTIETTVEALQTSLPVLEELILPMPILLSPSSHPFRKVV